MGVIDMRSEEGKPARAYIFTETDRDPVEVDRGIPLLAEYLKRKSDLHRFVQDNPDLMIILQSISTA